MPQAATPALHAAAPLPGAARHGQVPDLSRDDDVAFAIDVATLLIVAASPAARREFGVGPKQPLPIALDAAMPALHRLKLLSADLQAAGVIEALDFWSLTGALVSRAWRVAPVGRGASPTVLLVRSTLHVADDGSNDSGVASAEAPIAALETSDTETPQPLRDDAETLKEIARQIREGRLDGRDETSATAEAAASAADPDALDDPPDVESEFDAPAWPPPAALTALPPRAAPSSLAPEDLARLAHELKTPLTAIAAAAEIMRDEQLGDMGNDRYLDYARDIHESAAHALAVISRLLSRGDARDAELDRIEIIDLNDLVARTVATLQPIAAERRVTLAVDASEGQPLVTASATALRQILLNLLSNALKFTPPRGDVRAVTGYLPDGGVFLVVRDTGDGIDEATVSHALSQAEAPIAERPGGGYGIGLPLTCRLVADIGAAIEFDSAPGRGTAVLIAFGRRRGGRR